MRKWGNGLPVHQEHVLRRNLLIERSLVLASLIANIYLLYDSTFGHLPLSSFIFLSLALAVVFQFCD